MSRYFRLLSIILLLCTGYYAPAQQRYELNYGWQCIRATDIAASGEDISRPSKPLKGWLPAVVPGTVLTTLLHNKRIPDPFYGMNNKLIPDISVTGRDHYTYWFTTDFKEHVGTGEHVFITFRGVNYSYDVYLNGRKVNEQPLAGMYQRRRFDITAFLSANGNNRLAVIVYPPDPVGKPNGGQGGDGMIAHNLTNQYVAGWDWIQPIADRNTGIWDKVIIEKTGSVSVGNTHVVTLVSGKRALTGTQSPSIIKVTAEVVNNDLQNVVNGKLRYIIDGKEVEMVVKLGAGEKRTVALPDARVANPRLWWPNGYGSPELYKIDVEFLTDDKKTSGKETVTFGIRELSAPWNSHTQSRELYVNGQRIFIKGGNRILSDELLRFSDERYNAEVRFHRDMNLNLIRVWGGGITERPEFYDACDKYGLLVMQDFWVSGDCNGRWDDPLKLEDTTARRRSPDNHKLFVDACADQVLMLRNHPSLAIWCGGNEIKPPADILGPLRDSVLPKLDGTRFFFEYSNDDSMSLDAHDGPYIIQRDNYFWEHRSWGFNSEIGSVGIGDLESLERFIPAANLVAPTYDTAKRKWAVDSVWQYHKFSGYDSSIEKYGHAIYIEDYAKKAQLVNYNQYRSLIESVTARMWNWYTGVIIWKTQNPWTAMVGQMYDVYLDPNACLYGLAEGAKPTHVLFNPLDKIVVITNHEQRINNLKLQISCMDMNGKTTFSFKKSIQDIDSILHDVPYTCYHFNNAITKLAAKEGAFLNLKLSYTLNGVAKTDENLYWLPDKDSTYSGLAKMPVAPLSITATEIAKGKIYVHLTNAKANSIAFFNRISLTDSKTKKRILPVFYNNNYISVLPGGEQWVTIDYSPQAGIVPEVCIEGWNVPKQFVAIKKK